MDDEEGREMTYVQRLFQRSQDTRVESGNVVGSSPALQSELAAARNAAAEAKAAATRAELAAAVTQERLERLEASETIRRQRGRWARLRAAWRGG
jgi:predicted Rossmann fold nucleotide-binding protein DprA/Smf involved in DNA uptake